MQKKSGLIPHECEFKPALQTGRSQDQNLLSILPNSVNENQLFLGLNSVFSDVGCAHQMHHKYTWPVCFEYSSPGDGITRGTEEHGSPGRTQGPTSGLGCAQGPTGGLGRDAPFFLVYF